jgi:hypothetical protein
MPEKFLSAEAERELQELIERNRVRALWSLPRDYYPTDLAAMRQGRPSF